MCAPRSLQLDRSDVDPVESEVGLGEVEAPAPDGSDEVSDEGAQPVLSGGCGQQAELHGA